MSAAKRPRKGPSGERIMVAVRDEGAVTSGQASIIDSTAKAERIVAGLIEAGVEPQAVTALRARELPLRVSYQWTVELVHKPGAGLGAEVLSTPAPDGLGAEVPSAPTPAAEPVDRFLRKTARFLEEITPDSPFQLRMDRVLWLGLWAASLVILAMSIMASYSRGDSREFVVAPSSSSSDRASQAPGAALESNSRPGVTPTAPPQTSMPSCATSGPQECQCNDFATQPEAQAYYQRYPPASGHDVDPDRDGVVCEWLPQTAPSSGR
jgi:hypothetical protein